jgi:hypothetical protein
VIAIANHAKPFSCQPTVTAMVTGSGAVSVSLGNPGRAAVRLCVYPLGAAPTQHDIAPGGRAEVAVPSDSAGRYDVAVYGPNGFLRHAGGRRLGARVEVAAMVFGPTVRLVIVNNATAIATVRVACQTGRPAVHPVPAGATVTSDREAGVDARGWYDIIATVDGDRAYRRRFAGHVEHGAHSVTG